MKINITKTVLIKLLLSVIIANGIIETSHAQRSNHVLIYWDDSKKFTDIDAGNNAQHYFTKQVKKALNLKFAKLMGQLPAKYHWTIHIHDVDLAGKVTRAYNHHREPIRVYDTFFNPSITFSYRLLDNNNQIIANNKHFKLTDFYVTRYPAPRFMQRFLSYEKYMVEAWFNKVLLPYVLASK